MLPFHTSTWAQSFPSVHLTHLGSTHFIVSLFVATSCRWWLYWPGGCAPAFPSWLLFLLLQKLGVLENAFFTGFEASLVPKVVQSRIIYKMESEMSLNLDVLHNCHPCWPWFPSHTGGSFLGHKDHSGSSFLIYTFLHSRAGNRLVLEVAADRLVQWLYFLLEIYDAQSCSSSKSRRLWILFSKTTSQNTYDPDRRNKGTEHLQFLVQLTQTLSM